MDELSRVPFSKEGSELFFQVLAERNEKGANVITINLGFADWTQVFGDAVMTTALLDRLTHKTQIIHFFRTTLFPVCRYRINPIFFKTKII